MGGTRHRARIFLLSMATLRLAALCYLLTLAAVWSRPAGRTRTT